MSRVLVIDDEEDIRYILAELLGKRGFTVEEASNGIVGLEAFRAHLPDAVLLDHNMPGMDGLTTLAEIKKIDPEIPVIMITAYGDIRIALEAMRLGAHGFINKPFDIDGLVMKVNRAIDKSSLEREIKKLYGAFENIAEWFIGRSPLAKKAIVEAGRVSSSTVPVLIEGGQGTGKNFIAELIHALGARSHEKEFIRADLGKDPCPEVERFFSGQEEGFIGATLLVERVERASQALQSRLLELVRKNVPGLRVISTARLGVEEELESGNFSRALYDCMKGTHIYIPPLKERVEDITYLAERFILEITSELVRPPLRLSMGAVEALTAHNWPGNLRELKYRIRRAILVCEGGEITPEGLGLSGEGDAFDGTLMPLSEIAANAVREAETAAIRRALSTYGSDTRKAAAALSVGHGTLLSKMLEYEIR